MTFRTRLLLVFGILAVATVAVVGSLVTATTRRAFERLEDQRIRALVAQFRREFERRGHEVVQRVSGIAGMDSVLNIAIGVNRPEPDYSLYVNEAQTLANAQGLDFLELVAADGTIVSSAQWPARFGYKEEWLPAGKWSARGPFLKREPLPNDEVALALLCVRMVAAGDQHLYVVGGQALDREFVASLVLPAGMRALLYRNLGPVFSPSSLIGANGPVNGAGQLAPLIEDVRGRPREVTRTIQWSRDPADAETFQAIPLSGAGDDLLGVLLVGSSRRDLVRLERFLRTTGFAVGGAVVLLALLLGWWATARVTRPVQALAEGSRKIAAGNWNTRVDVASGDEIGQLARAFNQMTAQLLEQRDRLVQAERVAAWRELARRLAHELKNPLFPLQITVENMQRARASHPDQFDEVFRESTATLLAELGNLRQIIARFSDFAKMPRPELRPTDLNELVRATMRLFDAQLRDSPLEARLELDPELPPVAADADLIGRALHNLVLNALDAMPGGGVLSVRTRRAGTAAVQLEVSDTGQGLTPEECERLFTPYYTTKTHGTGLGLAIVQSVVSDHGGRISVESAPGRGATFRIELRAEGTGDRGPGTGE